MQRPIGIFIAGVILLIFGLFGLLLFGIGILSISAIPALHTSMTPFARMTAIATEGVFAGISVFSCVVAVALFRMRSWARYSSIVLAALGAGFCGLSAIMMLLLRNMPLPAPNLSPQTVHSVLMVLAAIYFVLSAIALFWIFYFNRPSIRTAFASAEAQRRQPLPGQMQIPPLPSAAPPQHAAIGFAQLVLWIAAALFLIGAASMAVLMVLGTPIFLLGWTATGPAAFLIEILFICLLLYAGIGLFRRWRTGWYLAVALQGYSLLAVMLLLVPGYAVRMIASSETIAMRFTHGAAVNPASVPFMMASSAVGGLVALGILVALIRRRHSYLS